MAQATTPSGAVVDTNTGGLITGPTNTGTSTSTSTTGTTPDTNSFMAQLQQKLLGQSDIISSENTGLEDKINQAIASVNTGQNASAQAIGLNYDQQIQQAQDNGGSKLTSALELQRGFATNVAGLKQLAQDTDKQVQSLESQKQQLILQGQAQAAQTVSGLQLQAIQFQQQAQQQVFSNLLGMGQFAQQQQQNNIAQQGQDLQQQTAIANIATKYGLSVGPGETLASITTKAAPFASKEEQQQMALATAQIASANATAAKAYADIQANKPLDAVSLAALGAQYNQNPTLVTSKVGSVSQLGQIAAEAGNQLVQTNKNVIVNNKASGQSKTDAVNSVVGNNSLSPDQQSTLLQFIDSTYGTQTQTDNSGGLPALLGKAGIAGASGTDASLSWIFGVPQNTQLLK